MYVMDSILKNVTGAGNYKEHIEKIAHRVFVHTFEMVNPFFLFTSLIQQIIRILKKFFLLHILHIVHFYFLFHRVMKELVYHCINCGKHGRVYSKSILYIKLIWLCMLLIPLGLLLLLNQAICLQGQIMRHCFNTKLHLKFT